MRQNLKMREREMISNLNELKRVLELASCAPSEMKRHHSFVVECARLTDRVADELRWMIHEFSPVAKHAHSILHVATSAQSFAERMLELSPDEVVADRSIARGCLRACKQVVDHAFSIRSDVRSITARSQHFISTLREDAALIRAGASAIVHNLSADDAEANVRRSHIRDEIPSDWLCI